MRIGIVTADPLRAVGLEAILNEQHNREAVVCDLPSAVTEMSLKVLLLDDHFEGDGLLAAVARLRRSRPELKLIVLGEAPDFEYIQTVVGAGARGYLLETATEAEIQMAIDVVLDGSVWAPRKVLARLIDASRSPGGGSGTNAVSVAGVMTARERQVLELLIGGSSNREIGQALGIDEVTVKAHLGRMLRKTQSKNRVELTLRALEERTALKKELKGGGPGGDLLNRQAVTMESKAPQEPAEEGSR